MEIKKKKVFRAKIQGVEARLASRGCHVLIKLMEKPPEAWHREFMRNEHPGHPFSASKIAINGNTVIIKIPKLRRKPIEDAQVEYDFKMALERIREIDRRFLIFEENLEPQQTGSAARKEEILIEGNSIIESIQTRLDSILSDWDKNGYLS